MKTMPAREAGNAFGVTIDTAPASLMPIEKHERGVAVVVAVNDYEQLTGQPVPDRRTPQNEKKS